MPHHVSLTPGLGFQGLQGTSVLIGDNKLTWDPEPQGDSLQGHQSAVPLAQMSSQVPEAILGRRQG